MKKHAIDISHFVEIAVKFWKFHKYVIGDNHFKRKKARKKESNDGKELFDKYLSRERSSSKINLFEGEKSEKRDDFPNE